MKANFYPKTPKRELTAILLTATFKKNTTRLRYTLKFSNTGEIISIPPSLWDSKNQIPKMPAKTKHKHFVPKINALKLAINNAKSYLNEIEVFANINNIELTEGYIIYELDKKFNVSSKNKSVSEFIVKNSPPPQIALTDYWSSLMDKMKEGKMLTDNSTKYNIQTITSYNQTYNILKWFDYVRKTITYIDKIDRVWYSDFIMFLTNEQEFFDDNGVILFQKEPLSPSTIGSKHIKNLKFVLKNAFNNSHTSNNEFSKEYFIRPKNHIVSHSIALTENELQKLFDLELYQSEKTARDLFLVAAYTALRFSDFSKLKSHNFKKNGKLEYIEMATTKTKKTVFIPILWNNLRLILKQYDYNLPTLNSQNFNRLIKIVAEKAEINDIEEYWVTKGGEDIKIQVPRFKLIASHTGRRSGATNLIENGIPPEKVMLITGHSKYETFKQYVKLDALSNVKDVSELFTKNNNKN